MSNALINEALLIAVLAITTYAVLTVDQTAWRGWYFHEVLYRIPFDNWNAYESAIAVSPVPIKAAITGITYLIGDWLAQVCSSAACAGVLRCVTHATSTPTRCGIPSLSPLSPTEPPPPFAYYQIQPLCVVWARRRIR